MKIAELIKRVKLPARASIYYLVASVIGKAVSFLITPFATRLLSREDFGQFSLYMAILGGVSVVCSALTSGSAIYKGIKDHNDNRQEYLKNVLAVNLAFSLLICILLLAFMPFLKLKRFLLIPMSLQILCDGTVAIAMSSKRFDYKYKTVAWVAIIIAVLPPVMAIVILKRWGGGYIVRIYAMLFVSICLAAYSIAKIYRGSKKKTHGMARYVIKSSTPLLPHSISSAMSVQADKLFITSIMGASALAKYSVVYSLGIALQFTVSAIGSALSPWIIRRLDAGEEKKICELVLPMTVGYCALSQCLVAVAPEAMLILAPRDYLDALPAILPIALSTPFLFISSVATVGIVHSGKSRYAMRISLFGVALCIILNYMLIGGFGFVGAGAALLICQGVTALIGVAFLEKAGLGEMLSLGKIVLTCVVSALVGLLFYLMRESVALRLFTLILPGIALLYCLKKAGELVMETDKKKLP
ncbi:MAG: oligosaccharide flippase family protein [Clostridia bacterium]|nr:oligosaccharide flippase family protein [Clostridia bacterium]